MRRSETIPMHQLRALDRTYSADKLTENRIRGALSLNGKLYVSTGGCYSKSGIKLVNADELVPVELWNGETVSYSQAGERANMEDGWRGNKFYQGIVVSHKGKKFVLAGREVEFSPESGTTITATKQLSLFDC